MAILEQTDIPRLRLGSLEPWELPEIFSSCCKIPASCRICTCRCKAVRTRCCGAWPGVARPRNSPDSSAEPEPTCPDINITTDIIVGFPGESGEEWEEGLEFIETQAFGHIHIFSYSIREGTKAAALPDQVPSPVKKARAQQLQQLAQGQKRAVLAHFLGRNLPVLWEGGREVLEDGRQRFRGFTPNYLRVETLAEPGRDLSKHIASVRLTGIADSGEHLVGELAPL